MNYKKVLLILVAIIIVAGGFLLFLRGDEDTWLCQNGQWVKHGQPSALMPTEPCGQSKPAEKIIVFSPQAGQTIKSPLSIKGKAVGNWFFEASFPIKLLDGNGVLLAATAAQAQSDWLTENFVNFKTNLEFPLPTTGEGVLVFRKDNPSGLPEQDEEWRLPIKFDWSKEKMSVKAYFNNSQMDPEASCNKVFPVNRTIDKTTAVARAALEELLKGPTVEEKSNNFFTNLNDGVKIQKLTIANGIAKVDFDDQLEYQVGGSCRVSAIRAQITETLKQFTTVKEVIISVNGRTEDILQP